MIIQLLPFDGLTCLKHRGLRSGCKNRAAVFDRIGLLRRFLSYNEKNVWWNAWSDVATGNSRQRWLGKMNFPQGDLDVIEEVRAAKAIKFALQSIETVSVRFADRNAAEPIVAIGVLKAP